jgi:NAD(P)-dependent dehydrogenase (short-subunit alcohol dehydrogenase family)
MDKQNWTTRNIPDLSGKTIIVTGGNSGLGFESVKAFAGRNAFVVMACRSLEKGNMAKKEILRFFPAANINVMELDLANLESVRNFAADFLKNNNRLDVLLE